MLEAVEGDGGLFDSEVGHPGDGQGSKAESAQGVMTLRIGSAGDTRYTITQQVWERDRGKPSWPVWGADPGMGFACSVYLICRVEINVKSDK